MNTKIVTAFALFAILFGCAFCDITNRVASNVRPYTPTHGTHKPTSSPFSTCEVTPPSTEPIKVLVPLYIDPGSSWDQLVSAAEAGVPTIAIINPSSGPDKSGPNAAYATYIKKLIDAGIDVIGYVHTSYGNRSLTAVFSDIETYASLYSGLVGIFIDEASADASDIPYYSKVYDAITSKSGYTNAILNPGIQPDQGYLNVSTSLVVFEDAGSKWEKFSSQFSSWVSCAPNAAEQPGYKYRFTSIAYATKETSLVSMLSSMATKGMGLIYVTDGAEGCCTYNSLASYYPTETSTVHEIN